MTTRAEIEAEFEGVRDPAVLKGLARLCDTFRVTAEELSAEWDIVELNAATSRALSLDALADLEGQVKASQAKKKARQLAPARSLSAPSDVLEQGVCDGCSCGWAAGRICYA